MKQIEAFIQETSQQHFTAKQTSFIDAIVKLLKELFKTIDQIEMEATLLSDSRDRKRALIDYIYNRTQIGGE